MLGSQNLLSFSVLAVLLNALESSLRFSFRLAGTMKFQTFKKCSEKKWKFSRQFSNSQLCVQETIFLHTWISHLGSPLIYVFKLKRELIVLGKFQGLSAASKVGKVGPA